ncbi:hypothetical protein EDB87DRAFT_676855 [Lactarius vividus]|nr:hypothetical protein EDB87DRAFT_676855 [Lactarius vividus]
MDNQWPVPHTDPQYHHGVRQVNYAFHIRSFQCLISRSHLPRIVLVPLSNPTKGVKIAPFRIVPVRGVPRYSPSTLKLVHLLCTPLDNRIQRISNVVAPYYVNQDQDVIDNRDTSMIAPARLRTQFVPPNTGGAQDNYVPTHERAGPSNMRLLQAPTLETSIAESRRRLASRYLNNADAHVSMIRLEPGASGQFQVIITLEMTNVF